MINYYGDDSTNIRVYFKDAPWGPEDDTAFLEEQFIPGRSLTGEFPDLSICGKKSYSIPFTLPDVKKSGIDYRIVIIKVNDNGLTPETEYFASNTQLIYRLSTDYNLAAAGITAGVSSPSPSPNHWYTGTPWFRNDSQSSLSNVPVAVYNNGSVLSLKDEYGNPISAADFAPGQTREFTFSYLFSSSGYSILEAVISTDPLATIYPEENYDDNKKHTIVSAAVGRGGGGDGELVFLAHRQKSYLDAMGYPKH